MQPHNTSPWWVSVADTLGKKVTVLEEYDDVVSSPSLTMRIPAVIVLKKYLARHKNEVRFSRRNVYARDGWRCQFCAVRFAPHELTMDHVLPRSKGGRTVWENIATSCRKCNGRKGGRTPEQAGMHLLTTPVKPKSLPISGLFVLPSVVPALWLPYLEGHATLQRSA
jgi:5-methylcytosine-specific restriction endonuclease McrA